VSDIVERLRGLAKAEMFLGAYTEAKSITDAADEIERLRAALANEQARGVHTCHEHCERPMCVMQRAITERDSMIERLRARLAEAERLETELIYAAGRMSPEAALRFIQQAENAEVHAAIDAAMGESRE